ncbi:hypothetical protein M0D21_21910 [Aquimarina sp. D1M17]|uniref:hypothetical protein n=1 Tax=Aquimarina acroporae TaxID=2937283 RepID=UPI0020BFB32B|nr:hypothetical protein [Aquimarina acroporae]MCK8524250.1 hypothetical protein [Aquimarina acroporae]
MKELNFKELVEINGGGEGSTAEQIGEAIGYGIGVAAHHIADFGRGVWDGISSLWN